MAKLTIISVSEETVIPSGRRLKKLEVNKEGLDWNFNRVTIWEDHPAYEVIKAGMEMTKSYIHETEQDKINPNNNKPYKNYTLREGQEPQRAPQGKDLEKKVDALYFLLRKIADHLNIDGEKKEESIPYPDEDIKPEDIPF